MAVLIKQILQPSAAGLWTFVHNLEITMDKQSKNREQIDIIRKEEVLYKKHRETSWVMLQTKQNKK